MENHLPKLDAAFHALADPTRRAVVARLGAGPASVTVLAAGFEMGLPAFLKHVRVLEDSGLIRSEKCGRVRTCRLAPERLVETERWLADQRAVWEGRVDRLAAFVEARHQEESGR